MRFHRSIKIFPGLRLNLSKSGLGLSAGVRGLKVGIDAKGRSYVNAGIPGTGLSVRKYSKTGAVPRDASPTLQPPRPPEISGSVDRPVDTDAESKVIGPKGVCALVGLSVVILGVMLSASHRGENSATPPGLTPEQKAAGTAERELARLHPEFTPTRITPDGSNATKKTANGYEVQLHYLPVVGDFMPFVCQVQGMTALCAVPTPPPRPRGAAAATPSPQQVPTKGLTNGPAVGGRTYVGPRGGVYHYSRSGRKVYQRKRR